MSYFRIIPKKFKLKTQRRTLTREKSLRDQLFLINQKFTDFLKFYDEKYKYFEEYGFKNRFEQYSLKSLEHLKKNFEIVLNNLRLIVQQNISINRLFKCNKHSKVSKRNFYLIKKKLCNFCDHLYVDYIHSGYKLPIKKHIELVYDELTRSKICDYYFYKIHDKNSFFNKTNLWLDIRENKVNSISQNTNKLSYKTFSKIIKSDQRYGPIKLVRNRHKHEFRKTIKQLGRIQMDLKVLGLNQNSTNKYVYIFDCIDIGSRLVYSRVLNTADTTNVMNEVINMKEFFIQHGINIKNIQTDNAMMFKKTNFVHSSVFNNWCEINNITRSFIPLNQPECDGCVERYHRTLDNEFVPKILHSSSLNQINNELIKFNEYYNTNRRIHLNELNHLSIAKRYMTPINLVKYLSMIQLEM